jgi:hypothetical protein
MIKNFPKSRLCVVDVLPALKEGIKKAILFAGQHGISLSTTDGRRLLFSFCIKDIQETFNKAQSPYSKVACISKTNTSKKLEIFVESSFSKIVSKCPFPYCGIHELNSPDLEFAAKTTLEKITNKKEQFNKLLRNLKIRNI